MILSTFIIALVGIKIVSREDFEGFNGSYRAAHIYYFEKLRAFTQMTKVVLVLSCASSYKPQYNTILFVSQAAFRETQLINGSF